MSEHQHVEFQTAGRLLTAEQRREIGKTSTRAEITSTRFFNEYHFGNFSGDANEFLRKWFDLHVYFAN